MSTNPSSCPRCGTLITVQSESCPKCGVILSKAATGRRITRASEVLVTTGELRRAYDILAPVYTEVSNKVIFGSRLDELCTKYQVNQVEKGPDLVSTLAYLAIGELPLGQQQLPSAFAVCLQELRLQTIKLGGDAVVWLRQETELDTSGFQFFYMQMYGTAVRQK